MQFHRLLEFFVVLRLGARVRLRQRLHRLVHQGDADPFAIRRSDDRAVLGAIGDEGFFGHSLIGFVGNLDD
ncbi:MAG: hypothetical protein JMDDDDMK_03814 [Acidobacteria bacterium]|nr:hypothetical protein [Acidobacteriota bacterium]